MARWIFHAVLAVVALGAGTNVAWAADSDQVPAPIEQEFPEIEEADVADDVLTDREHLSPGRSDTLSVARTQVPKSLVRTPLLRPPRA